MKPFKFLNYPILKTQEGINIFTDEEFYSVNKEDIVHSRKTTKKHTIVKRVISESDKHKFKTDNDILWYFKTKDAAEEFISKIN